jgi:hypothetical protein
MPTTLSRPALRAPVGPPADHGPVALAARRHAAALAADWAGDPARWRHLVRPDEPGRWYTPLFDGADANAWLIQWPTGTGIDPHAHGSSAAAAAAAVAVVAGCLTERWAAGTIASGPPRTRRLPAGRQVSFGADHVHAVRNDDAALAVSVHVYAPRLTVVDFAAAEVAAW